MPTDLVFAIVIAILAVILFGTVLFVRRRVSKGAEASGGPGGVAFKDCYDLGATESGHSSATFNTVCNNPGGSV